MKETTNLKLKKYDYTDNVDMSTGHNLNMDIIDTEIKKVNDKVDSKPTTALGTSFDNSTNGMASVNVQKAIEEVNTKSKANETSILTLQNNDGNLASLNTTNKANLVSAINEVFQSANNGKTTIATAIGSPLVNTDTFSAMGTKIDTLTGKLATNLTAKGVTAAASEKMSILIDKVASIAVGKKYSIGTSSNEIIIPSNNYDIVLTTNAGFIPSSIYIDAEFSDNYSNTVYMAGFFDNIHYSSSKKYQAPNGGQAHQYYIKSVTDNTIVLNYSCGYMSYTPKIRNIKWTVYQ